ncbi:hypothetical protein GGR56DRAFT_374731 [Xylariaceae sp. FL0804]|nr:hypothetical protein GGR56DRAFT_374731 [Xylariaceae sp. FL0804]
MITSSEVRYYLTMAEPSSEHAIAKAFSGLNTSDAELTSGAGSQRPRKSSKSETPIGTKQKCRLLELPVEIRLEIYDLLLVSRVNREGNPSWPQPWCFIGNTYQKKIILDGPEVGGHRTVNPAVLQACRQIYLEAVPILYSQNVFNFNQPEFMLGFINQIGHTNMKLIRSLDMYVLRPLCRQNWLHLFHVLSENATGLKSLVVRWWGSGDRPLDQSYSGRNIAFAQALSMLSQTGVEKLRIEGYYAKPWPAYFRDKFGARVVEAEDEDENDTDKDDDSMRKKNYYREDLRKFQEGTDTLNPWGSRSWKSHPAGMVRVWYGMV